LKTTSILNLSTYDATADSARLTSEYINNTSANFDTIDEDLGPFKETNLYVDEDGDVCQKDTDTDTASE